MQATHYPVFMSLESSRVLIAGLGDVGRRKLAGLVSACPAAITACEPGPLSEEAAALLRQAEEAGTAVTLVAGAPDEDMLDSADLVFLCTSDHALNERMALACRERRILCNCTDNPSLGSFHVPAQARDGAICAALSTGGASPALARRWRMELEDWMRGKARLAELMGRLRPLLLGLGLPQPVNRDIFRDVSRRDMEEALASGDTETARALLAARLPGPLRNRTEELLP